MNNPSKDIRYAQTEEDLLTAFDLLCREKDPAKITVAEISKKTGVTRSTFYNHYQDVLQLIETLENRILNDLRGVLVMLQPGSEQPEKLTRTYFSALCRYVKKSGFLIRQLKTLEGAEFVGRAISLLHEYVREFADAESSMQYAVRRYDELAKQRETFCAQSIEEISPVFYLSLISLEIH